MTVEQQVCSLELAKRLKKLRVKQESLFYWYLGNGSNEPVILTSPEGEMMSRRAYEVAAFTVAELGEMLPMHHNYGAPQSGKCNDGNEYVATYVRWGNLWHDRAEFERDRLDGTFLADIEADARAKMVIHLLEKGLMSARRNR